MRVGLLTFPSLGILNLPVEIIDSRIKGEDVVYNFKLPEDHPNQYSLSWNAWGQQYVREIERNDTLVQLFMNGPTFDGDMVSKKQRDEMFGLGLVARFNGYQTLTLVGLKVCMMLDMDRTKEARG